MRVAPLLLSVLAAACATAVGSSSAVAVPIPGPPVAPAVGAESASSGSGLGSRQVAAASVSAAGVAAALPSSSGFDRIAGSNRYTAAVNVSKASVCAPTKTCEGKLGGSKDPVDIVFVASGATYPDALGAGPLAYGLGPLLLVPGTGTVPTAVTAEIQRIKPKFIVVIGGTATVSLSVERQLAKLATEGTDRIEGANRYAVAAQVARHNDKLWRASDDDEDGTPDNKGISTVVLASGQIFSDALGGGAAAANSRGALLLTRSSSLPDDTKAALAELKPGKVIIVGGTSTVSSAVVKQVQGVLPGASVKRAAGANRYEAAVALSKQVFTSAESVFLVSGKKFPDALSSAPLAGLAGGPTLLTSGACVTSSTRTEASRVGPTYVVTIGGTASVSDKAARLGVC